jgi:cytoskeletal protein CcmA (bactofilin family)
MGILGKPKSAGPPAPPPGGLSIIAVGMSVTGNLDSHGTVKVEGSVEGHVRSRSQVLVAKGGEVHGDIDASEAVIGGAVYGAIRAVERVEIQSGATVNGDITTRRIAVAEGGALNGQIRMSDQEAQSRSADSVRTGQQAGVAVALNKPRSSVPVARVAVPPRLPASGAGH